MEAEVVGVRPSPRKAAGWHGLDLTSLSKPSIVAGATLVGHELPQDHKGL